MTLGQRIRQARKRRGLAQTELAKRAGFGSHSRVSLIETGATKDPGFSTVVKIARAMGVSLDVLAGIDNSRVFWREER